MRALSRIALLILALAAVPALAQSVTYQVTPNVYTCNNSFPSTIYCTGIPFNMNGTPAGSIELYGSYYYPGGVQTQYGWGFWNSGPLGGSPEFVLSSWGFSPKPTAYHQGYPYGLTSFPCAGNCSTFSGTVTGFDTMKRPYSAQVTVDFWYYHSCGGRTCITSAIATGGQVVLTYGTEE